MALIELNKDNLESTINDNDIVLIDFWAGWCGPCKMFKPVFEKASETHSDVAFASCDTEDQQEVAASFGVRSIPTLAIFRDQILVFMQPGALPEAALEGMAEVIRDTGRGLHLHVAEDRYDVSHSHVTYGEDIVSRLDRHGLLNDRTLLIHGVHLSEAEVDILNERDGFLVHNARSNMNNAVGYNPHLPKLRNLALGTDGIGANMYAELQTAYFKHKEASGPWWPGEFLGALQAGNRILERLFGGSFGRLDAGCAADVVVARYAAPTPLVPENVAGHFVFGQNPGMTETVIVDGRVVLSKGAFPEDIDEAAIAAGAREQATLLWRRMDEIAP